MRLLSLVLVAFAAAAPPDPAAVLQSASLASRSGRFDEAASAFRSVLAADPCSGPAILGLVTALIQAKDIDAAAAAADSSLAACPQSAAAHAALGDARFRLGKLAAAETAYRQAMKLDGKNARAWWGYSRICRAHALRSSARHAIETAYRLDPDDPDIVRAYAHTRTRTEEEIAALERYLALAELRDPVVTRQIRFHLDAHRAADSLEQKLDPASCRSCVIPMPVLMSGPRRPRGWGVDVRLNDGKPVRLLLDTGAGGVTIDPRTAEKSKVRRLASWETRGLGDEGPRPGWLGLADTVRIGDVVLHNVIVSVATLRLGDGIQGLAGTNLFSSYQVTLDFDRRKLTLARHDGPAASADSGDEEDGPDAAPPASHDVTRVLRFGHLLLVPTRANGKETGLFLIDTGAWDNLLSTRFARQVAKVSSDGRTLAGVEGEINKVHSADTAELEFAAFRYPGERVVATDLTRLNHSVGVEIAGILGRTVLDRLRLTIDYRNHTVRFEKGR
jgi:predicted aspartyl protease/thioredoxin-like negative regulator of GroEL